MGGQQHEQQRGPKPQLDGGDQAATHAAWEDAKKSLDFVIEFATSGRGRQTDLPAHISRLGGWKEQAKTLIPEIAQHARGEIVLECAALLGMSVVDQVAHALKAKAKIKADQLRAHLRLLRPGDVATLGERPGLVAEVRKLLTGSIAEEVPELARFGPAIYQRLELLQWWLETTTPTLAALQLSTWHDEKLTEALDALAPTAPQAWGWLDHMAIAPHINVGFGLEHHRDSTKNAAAKTKLTALAAQFKHEMKDREADKPQAKADLATQLSGSDDKALLAAAARTQGEGNADSTKLRARLAGESADVVVQYLETMNHATTLKEKIELLDLAAGARGEHLRHVIRSQSNEDIVAALVDDGTRKRVQAMAKGVRLRDLLSADDLAAVHHAVVKDEALRQWCYKDPDPRNTLWIAAGSGVGAKDGCRLVKSEQGNAWVQRLPRTADEIQLRRFVLNTTDTKMAAWVKANLLADAAHTVAAGDSEIVEPSRVVYGHGATTRLAVATAQRHDHPDPDLRPDPDRIIARLADLSEGERRAILASKAELTRLFEDLVGAEQRAVHLLQPTLPQLLAMPIANAPELASYAAGRREAEQVAAAEQAGQARRVFGDLSPFVALPMVRAPNNLAKALVDNEPLLDWILETTEPNQALEILAREPARKVAAEVMEWRSNAYAGLPGFDKLRRRGRESFKAIAKHMRDDDAKQDATDYVEHDAVVDVEADKRAARFNEASKRDKLWDGIDALYEAGGSRADLISLVQASEPSEQIELLSGSHGKTVRALERRVRLGPQHVFIDLDVQQLLRLPSAAEWLLGAGDSFAVLGLIGAPDTAKALGLALSRHAKLAQTFIDGLPRGQGLTVHEQHTLDQVARHVMEPGTLRRLFGARFDTKITATYDLGETKRLWAVLERLPPAQVNQRVIKGFTEQDLGGPTGQWDSSRGTIDLEQKPGALDGNDRHYQRGITLTADEVKAYYGLDDRGLAQAADPKTGWLVFEHGKYRVKPVNPRQFDATVLHEVGHSIDDLLGSSTELVYGLAGWKRYGYDQFEQFADEMGVFQHVGAADRPKVVEVWQQALRSKTAVSKLVGADHPAVRDKGSPLARWVDQDRPFSHNDETLKPIGDRVFLNTPTSLASVKKQTWDNAPTQYSMTAPAEFFAECYVEYYCRYDGTKDTEVNKGGRLANWIKKWFDEHVDKIRLNPQRVQGDKADNTA